MRLVPFVLAGTALSMMLGACSGSPTQDTGLDNHSLASMKPAVWVDPDGCMHWIIDDGIEGYMSPILNRDGTPDCV